MYFIRNTSRVFVLTAALSGTQLRADEPAAVVRGREALLGRSFVPAAWSSQAFENTWRIWRPQLEKPPEHFAQAALDRYGLHPAPYPNSGYPMGLREAGGFLLRKGISSDCLLCHGGSILGRSYVGLGNASLDLQGLFEDLARADGRSGRLPFTFSNTRGTTEAGAVTVFLLGWRQPDLSMRTSHLDLGLSTNLCEDAPAWWLLKKKRTMYHTGTGDARSIRALMQFMMSPLTPASTFHREESTFRDIRAFLLSLQPPRYPLHIDAALANQGKPVFEANCARCHGNYGKNASYPNRIVPLEVIGTDPARMRGLSKTFEEYFRRSWFGRERPGWLADDFGPRASNGYQAPPLDGVWATAPYLHNGSVPTVYELLKSDSRPKLFTRSFRTGEADFDSRRLGWKTQVLSHPLDPKIPPEERRRVYDTGLPGRGNQGHTFGDKLTEVERLAVIEYLKTL